MIPTSKSGLIARNRTASDSHQRRTKQQGRNGAERERADAVPSVDPADESGRDRHWDGAHEVSDPARQLFVTCSHVLDVEATDILARRAVQLLRERAKKLDGRRKRVDRARVDEDERAWQRRVARRELDRDHSAEAVPGDNRLLDPDLSAESRNVVGQVGNVVAVLRTVALPATPQVERRDGMCARKMGELRPERSVVAAPAGDKEELGLTASGPLVVEPYPVAFRIRHAVVSVPQALPGRRSEGTSPCTRTPLCASVLFLHS